MRRKKRFGVRRFGVRRFRVRRFKVKRFKIRRFKRGVSSLVSELFFEDEDRWMLMDDAFKPGTRC